MSKEIETIDTYIEQQTSQISELMQTVILLQTKVKMLELENKKLETINRVDLEKDVKSNKELFIRNSVRTNLTTSKRTMDPVQAKIVINGGFTTRKGAPEE
jgi:regulator of replication initiation timing